MKRISLRHILVAIFVVAGLVALVQAGLPAAALDPGNAAQRGVTSAGGGAGGGAQLDRAVRNVINVLLFVLGAIAVIMIVIGGIKYTISNGDSGQITSAKNTVLYAVIGLVIALLAYAIVNFVIGAF